MSLVGYTWQFLDLVWQSCTGSVETVSTYGGVYRISMVQGVVGTRLCTVVL